jgi:phosphomevalonate kinase
LAHRRAQGGRGSGYDVYASLYGGFGCLSGGAEPSWQSVELPWLPPLYLLRGPASVSTPNSLQHYERWKASNPGEWRGIFEESNQGVRRFLQADSWLQARPIFTELKELGLRLGERIGVPASVATPDSLDPELHKALGAGNELGIYIAEDPPNDPVLEAVAVAAEGVQWD